jgi:membrane-bound lytic murein transglycosylase A
VRILLPLLLLAACAAPDLTGTERQVLQPASFQAVPGWTADRQDQALPALLASCPRLSAEDATWTDLCREARRLPPTQAAAKAFFERRFVPVQASAAGQVRGHITGYYEPELRGSLIRTERYHVPLHGRPTGHAEATLPQPDGTVRRVVTRAGGGAWPDRGAIEDGGLDGTAPVIAWVDSPVDAFFLHIQGSGRVLLEDGGVLRVGYGGQNGHRYVAIGAVLANMGEIPRAQVTMQSIRAWLAANPDRAPIVMRANPSYVFMRVVEGLAPTQGAIGAMGVPLTPGRSVAVDRSHVPMGYPVFVATTDPLTGRPWRRLSVAQDVGGAIRGPVRVDVFTGWGEEAAERAGRMRDRGEMWVLLPRT